MKRLAYCLFVLLCTLIAFSSANGQITVEHHDDLQGLVENLFVSGGVKVFNVRFQGDNEGNIRSIGSFRRGARGPDHIFSRGLILSNGNVLSAIGPNQVPNSTFIEADASHSYGTAGLLGDPDLQRLVTPPTYDAAVLEFEFEAQSDSIFFRYIFASEEYTEWVDEPYNDIFAFFISGPGIVGMQNLALLPDRQAVSVNSVNHLRNTAYYIDNAYISPWQPAPHDIRYDGFTRVLVAKARVIPCRRYRLKIAIADVEDQVIDSAVLLEAFSLISNIDTVQVVGGVVPGTRNPTTWESCSRDIRLVYRRRNTEREVRIPFSLGGTARNQIDYRLSSYEFHFPVGVDSAVIHVHALWDELPEGTESVSLTYRPIGACEDHTIRFFIQDASPSLFLEPGRLIRRCGMPGDTILNLRTRVEMPGGNFGIEWRDRWGNVVNSGPNWMVRPISDTLLIIHATDRICNIPVRTDTLRYQLLHYDRQNRLTFSLSDTLICRGTALTYQPIPQNGTGNYSFSWSNGSTANQITLIVNQPQLVSLRISDECQSSMRTARVELHQSRTEVPEGFVVCAGTRLNVSPNLSSTSGWANFRWINQSTDTIISTELDLRDWLADQAYDLRFEARDGCGDIYSGITRIRLFPRPSVELADTVGVCEGEAYSLHPRFIGAGLRNLRWIRLSDSVIVSRNLYLSGIAVQDEHFQLEFEDTCGLRVQQTAFLKVSPRTLEVSSIQTEHGRSVCPGTKTQLSIEAQSGSGFYAYRWSNGSTSAQISVQVDSLREFSVTVSDGCLTFTRNIWIDVFPEPRLQINLQDTTLCRDSQLQMTALVSGGSGIWEPILWHNDFNELLGQGHWINRTFQRGERIWAQVFDGCGRQARDSLHVFLYPDLSLLPVSDQVICLGESVRLKAEASGTPPLTYSWFQLEDSLQLSSEAVMIFQPKHSKRYSILARDLCNSVFYEFEIRVIQPTLELGSLIIEPGQLLCKGTEVMMLARLQGGSGDFAYDWSVGSRDSIAHTTIQADERVRLVATDGCQVIDTVIHFWAHPLPRVVVPDSVILCTGEPVTLIGQATGGSGQWNRIEWLNPHNVSIGNEFRLRFEPKTSGNYQLLVEDGCGFKAVDSVQVRLIPIAELSLPPDTAICLGQSVHIRSQITDSNASTRYRWSPPAGLDDPVRSDPTAKPSFTTRYQLSAWTDGCASRSVEIEIQVRELPRIDMPPEFVLCKGRDSIPVEARSISGAFPFSYRWSPESVIHPIDSARSRAFSSFDQNLRLVVKDRFGCENQAYSLLRLAEVPKVVPLADTFFCRGEPGIQLQLSLTNSDRVRWSWIPETGIIKGTDSNRPWIRPDSTQDYQLVATSLTSNCSSDTLDFRVSVFERPIADLGPDRSICLGDSIHLYAKVRINRHSDLTYTWLIGDSPIQNQFNRQVFWPRQNTTFFALASDGYCQGPLDSVKVWVRPSPTVSIPKQLETCSGTTIPLRAQVTGSSSYRYRWHPPSLFQSNDDEQAIFYADSSVKIWVNVWGANCENPVSDSAWIQVSKPSLMGAARGTPPHTRRIYRGDTLRLGGWSAARTGVRYKWEPSTQLDNAETLHPWAKPDSSVTYTLTVIEGPCTSRDSILIEVVDRTLVHLQTQCQIPICQGDTLRLQAQRKSPVIRFSWHPVPLSIDGDTIALYMPLRTQTYWVIGRDSLTQEADTAWITIPVTPKPIAAFDWALSEPCSASVVSFENKSLYAKHFTWEFGDGSNSTNEIHPHHSYVKSGRYMVKLWVQSEAYCNDSTSDWIQVQHYPEATATWITTPSLPAQFYLPQSTVEIQVDLNNEKDWWIEWGDGTTSRSATSRHQFRKAGFYAPLLVVIDSSGCRNSIPLPSIEVLEPVLHLPNAFSPNGDDINDRWHLYYRGSEPIRIQIRSRTGQVVYKSIDPNDSWDGTCDGQPAPDGTYLVEVQIGGKTYHQTLELIR